LVRDLSGAGQKGVDGRPAANDDEGMVIEL